MNCLMILHQEGSKAYMQSVAERVVAMESFGFSVQTYDAAREAVAVGPPVDWLQGRDPDESILILGGKGLFADASDVKSCFKKYQDTGAIVVGLTRPEDHPCTLESFHSLKASGYLHRNDDGSWFGGVDKGETPVVVLLPTDDKSFRCLCNVPGACLDDLSLRVFLFDVKGNERCIGPLKFNSTSKELSEALNDDPVVVSFCVASYVDGGSYDVSLQFIPANGEWSAGNRPRRLVNQTTGEVIHGRQAFPEVYQVEHGVIMGTVGSLLRFNQFFEKGEVVGVPVSIDVPLKIQAQLLALPVENPVRQTKPVATIKCSASYLADGVSQAAERLDKVGQNRFRISKTFATQVAYASKQAEGVYEVENRIAMREAGCFIPEGLRRPTSVELMSDGALMVSDAFGALAGYKDGEAFYFDRGGRFNPFRLFGADDALFACDYKNRVVVAYDEKFNGEKYFDLRVLDKLGYVFTPCHGAAFDKGCIINVRDLETQWTTYIAFDHEDPERSVRLLDITGMLIPGAVMGSDEKKLLFEKQPFGIWSLEKGDIKPKLLRHWLASDWSVASARGTEYGVLVCKRSLMSIGLDGELLGEAVQLKDLIDINAPHITDAASSMDKGAVYLVESRTGQIVKIQTTLIGKQV